MFNSNTVERLVLKTVRRYSVDVQSIWTVRLWRTYRARFFHITAILQYRNTVNAEVSSSAFI